MKHLLLFLVTTWCLSCARHTATPSINILAKEAQGLLYLECDGKGMNRASAETDAKTFVLNRLMYDGIPDANVSDVRLPMIQDKSKLSAEQRSAINKLLQGEAINRFFTEVSHSGATKGSGGQLQRFTMKVNYDLFRRELEQKGVIRKLGF